MLKLHKYSGPLQLVGVCLRDANATHHQRLDDVIPIFYYAAQYLPSGIKNPSSHYWLYGMNLRFNSLKDIPSSFYPVLHKTKVVDGFSHPSPHEQKWGLFWMEKAQHEFLENISIKLPYEAYYLEENDIVLCELNIEERNKKLTPMQIIVNFVKDLIYKEFQKPKPNHMLLEILFPLLDCSKRTKWVHWSIDLQLLLLQHQIKMGNIALARSIELNLMGKDLNKDQISLLDRISQPIQTEYDD